MHASMIRVMCRTDARQREQAVRSGRIGKPLPFLSSQVMTWAASASPVETPTPFSKARASLNRLQKAMCLCSRPVSAGKKRRMWWDQSDKRTYYWWLIMLLMETVRMTHPVGWMWRRSPEVTPAEPPGCWGWCCLLVPESPKTAHTSTRTHQPSASPPDGWEVTHNSFFCLFGVNRNRFKKNFVIYNILNVHIIKDIQSLCPLKQPNIINIVLFRHCLTSTILALFWFSPLILKHYI